MNYTVILTNVYTSYLQRTTWYEPETLTGLGPSRALKWGRGSCTSWACNGPCLIWIQGVSQRSIIWSASWWGLIIGRVPHLPLKKSALENNSTTGRHSSEKAPPPLTVSTSWWQISNKSTILTGERTFLRPGIVCVCVKRWMARMNVQNVSRGKLEFSHNYTKHNHGLFFILRMWLFP